VPLPRSVYGGCCCQGGFVAVFTVEILLKLFGFGALFFFDNWNNVDLVVVGVSATEIVYLLSEMAAGRTMTSTGTSVVRLVRVLRVIRLVGFLERLNLLVEAFLAALQARGFDLLLVFIAYVS